jgi:hypothetical protein
MSAAQEQRAAMGNKVVADAQHAGITHGAICSTIALTTDAWM